MNEEQRKVVQAAVNQVVNARAEIRLAEDKLTELFNKLYEDEVSILRTRLTNLPQPPNEEARLLEIASGALFDETGPITNWLKAMEQQFNVEL